MRIFLSYGRDEHIELARRLKADLADRGHEVWFDEDCLKPGFDWECYIEKGLDWVSERSEIGRVILLMTPHSVRRPEGYCLNELARAINRSVKIIPVMVVWCEPPLSICRIQWLDMQNCIPVNEKPVQYEVSRNRLFEAIEENKLDREGNQAILLAKLDPPRYDAEISEHVLDFVGREWVFKHIDNWLKNSESSRIFWITGPPGVGKTAIAAYLCNNYREVAAIHFCINRHDEKSDPRRCVLSIAYQLGTQLPDYQERLIYLTADLNKSAVTLFHNLIVQPLSPPFPKPDRTILVVIDALDEATRDGRNDLVNLIASEFQRTPPWLRLFITSRPDREVMHHLQAYLPFHLNNQLKINLKDIRTYIFKSLSLLYPKNNIDKSIVGEILERSEGLFLYVEYVLKDLREGRLSLNNINRFPIGLGGIYAEYFDRQFRDLDLFRTLHRPLLEMLVAAKGPLSFELVKKSLGWSEYDINKSASSLGSLFPHKNDCIQPFHHTAIEWLTNPNKAGPYFIDIKEGQKRLADVCWSEYQTDVQNMSSYAITFLPLHLIELGRWYNLLELVTSTETGLIKRWVEGTGTDTGLFCLLRLIEHFQNDKKYRVIIASLATQVARIYSLWGEYDEAQKWINLSLQNTSYWKGRKCRAVAYHEQASLSLYQWNFTNAVKLYNKALQICSWGFPNYYDEAAGNLIGLATVSQTKYDFLSAISYACKSLKKAKKAGDINHQIAAERLIGSACRSLGRYEEANTHIEEALSLCEEKKVLHEKPLVLLLKGWLAYDQATLKGDIPVVGQGCFKQALTEAQSIYDLYCIIEAKISLGLCALATKETTDAEDFLRPLAKVLPEGRHPELQAGLYFGIAALSYQRRDYEKADSFYKQVVDFCSTYKIRTFHYKALIGLGAVKWHAGLHEAAENIWKQAIQIASEISNAKQSLAEVSIRLCKTDSSVTPR